MRRLLLALVALLVGLGLTIAVARPTHADGGATLAILVAQATGITRTSDATLASLAQVRSAEIVTDFGHRSLPELSAWSWGEVLAWNRLYADPYAQAITQWRNSSEHWAILANPAYQRIGCDHRISGDHHYFVCIVGTLAGGNAPVPPAPPIVNEIPNTAMEAP